MARRLSDVAYSFAPFFCARLISLRMTASMGRSVRTLCGVTLPSRRFFPRMVNSSVSRKSGTSTPLRPRDGTLCEYSAQILRLLSCSTAPHAVRRRILRATVSLQIPRRSRISAYD